MTDGKTKTVDGKPIDISALNIEAPQGLNPLHSNIQKKWVVLYRRASEVMAGMYTGIGCLGTPRSQHSHKSVREQHNSSNKTSN
jgi:hypothetical protein